MDSLFGNNIKLIPCYIARTSPNGTRIWVSPWGSNNEIEATVLSPIPTDILDGRRFMGFPSSREQTGLGDNALCAVVDNRYYIIGYFNQPDYDTGEKVLLNREDAVESLPMKNGVIFKISEYSHIVWKKSNHILTWLGEWANQTMRGYQPSKNSNETLTTKFKNIAEIAWGGWTKWTRTVTGDDDDDGLADPTLYKAVYTKSHEPEQISDANMSQKEKNDNIDDTMSSGVPVQGRPYNHADLPYIDKLIKLAGQIGEDTHIYEREARQSLDGDREKTAFTRLREGHREGILRELETENLNANTYTTEKTGSNINDTGRLLSKQYTLSNEDAEQVAQFTEEFGPAVADLYLHHIVDDVGNYVKTQKTTDGLLITVADKSDTNIVTLLIDHAGNVNLNASTKVVVEAPNIEIGEGSTEHIVLGDALLTWITTHINSVFNAHIHPTGVGPSGPPVTPGTAPSGADILSPAHTVK